MPIYKFLNHDAAPLVKAGSLKFGRLRLYRFLEFALGRGIGDADEGFTRSVLRGGHRPGLPENAALRARISSAIHVEEGADAVIADLTIRPEIDAFVLSLADGALEDFVNVFGPNAGLTSYDSCLQVRDLSELVHAVINGVTTEGRVGDHFEVHCGPGQYGMPDGDLTLQDPAGSPFNKAIEFSPQQEVRIVLVPKLANGGHSRPAGNNRFVEIQSDGLFEDIPWQGAEVPLRSYPKLTKERLAEAILDASSKDIEWPKFEGRLSEAAWREQTERLACASAKHSDKFWRKWRRPLAEALWVHHQGLLDTEEGVRLMTQLEFKAPPFAMTTNIWMALYSIEDNWWPLVRMLERGESRQQDRAADGEARY